jgi:hypothetical protein
MMHKIEPIEVEGTVRGGFTKRPYIVLVDGERLLNSQGTPVRFKDSITAALGGAREVDRRRRLAVTLASRLPAASDDRQAKIKGVE